jgi:hypothetical protein
LEKTMIGNQYAELTLCVLWKGTEVGVEWPFRNIIPSNMHNPVRVCYKMTLNLRLRMLLVGITNHRNP